MTVDISLCSQGSLQRKRYVKYPPTFQKFCFFGSYPYDFLKWMVSFYPHICAILLGSHPGHCKNSYINKNLIALCHLEWQSMYVRVDTYHSIYISDSLISWFQFTYSILFIIRDSNTPTLVNYQNLYTLYIFWGEICSFCACHTIIQQNAYKILKSRFTSLCFNNPSICIHM